MRTNDKRNKRVRRHKRVRAKIKGTAAIPRLSVFRSNRHVIVQLIDDVAGKTVVSVSDTEVKKSKKESDKKTVTASKVGEIVAKKAEEKKIHSVVFDRGGYKYHGLIKAVAEGARKGGLKL